jgi:sodium transport system ATP-binding protein
LSDYPLEDNATMIQIRHLRKRFRTVTAVDGLSFEARDGAITGLLGPNGAGKTTVLRTIGGVLKPDEGSVRIDGIDVSADPIGARRRVGALLDHTGLYERLSAKENLRYFGKLRAMPAPLLDDRLARLIPELDLEAIADRRTAGFSQGERMKVALGRALIHHPPNLLLDEPTNGLDVATIRTVRKVLRRLRDAGACVVLSSHVLAEIQELCDRVAIVHRGILVAEGSVEEICSATGRDSLEAAFVKLTGREEAVPC